MKQVQRGFTLIELVMVIVILGVLAAVAIPKFVDLKGDAQQAAVDGVAGALASASSINYAARSIKTTNGVPVVACTDLVPLLQGGLPTSGGGTWVVSGTPPTCSVTDGAKSASFPGIAIP